MGKIDYVPSFAGNAGFVRLRGRERQREREHTHFYFNVRIICASDKSLQKPLSAKGN